MHIENEVKLDFKDVLIRPKRSTLSSRSNVDLIRPFTLRNSRVEYSGVPIIAANMDTTGTFEMAEALGKYDLSVALHKHYSEDEYVAYFNGLKRKSTAFYSMGITDNDLKKFKAVMERAPGAIEYLCICLLYTSSVLKNFRITKQNQHCRCRYRSNSQRRLE